MTFLRSLAQHGTAILCTIHQPSAELWVSRFTDPVRLLIVYRRFQQFDRLLLLKKGGQTVFFGDLGDEASNIIQYYQENGARPIRDMENPAEYMLEVIGAGATASSDIDWHVRWKASREAQTVQKELDRIHTEGRAKPAVNATLHSAYATSWLYQVRTLLRRNAQYFWRNPDYLFAKIALCTIGGLFIGFSFWHSKSTQQGTWLPQANRPAICSKAHCLRRDAEQAVRRLHGHHLECSSCEPDPGQRAFD
jgi:ATP-binding cassette subfamily G (WHITE) protein 2 (SNQ2)